MPVERTQDSYPRWLGLGFDELGTRSEEEHADRPTRPSDQGGKSPLTRELETSQLLQPANQNDLNRRSSWLPQMLQA